MYVKNKEVAELLIKSGAKVNIKNINKQTPLEIIMDKAHSRMDGARGYHLEEEIRDSYQGIGLELLKNGAEISGNIGKKILQDAVGIGAKELVEMLIEKGVSVKNGNIVGENPLLIASRHKYTEIVNLLLSKGVNINIVNDSGNTALIESISPISVSDFSDASFIKLAKDNQKKLVELLINLGADVNMSNINDETPVMKASESGNKEIVELLIKSEASLKGSDIAGNNILIKACNSGNKEIVELLIKLGINTNETNNAGETALIISAQKNNKEIVELLIKNKANVNIKNKEGCTALSYAKFLNYKEVVQLLVKAGANTDVKIPSI